MPACGIWAWVDSQWGGGVTEVSLTKEHMVKAEHWEVNTEGAQASWGEGETRGREAPGPEVIEATIRLSLRNNKEIKTM